MCDNSFYSDILLSDELKIERFVDSVSEANPTEKAGCLCIVVWLSKSSDVSSGLNYSQMSKILNCVDATDDERRKINKLNDINSWNVSIKLLQIKFLILAGRCMILVYVVLLKVHKLGRELFQNPLLIEIPLWKGIPLEGNRFCYLKSKR